MNRIKEHSVTFESYYRGWIANCLSSIGFSVIQEHYCNKGIVDIYLPKKKIVIEVEKDLRTPTRIKRCKEQINRYADIVNAKEKWVIILYEIHKDVKERLKKLLNVDKVLDSKDILDMLPNPSQFSCLLPDIQRLWETKISHLDRWFNG